MRQRNLLAELQDRPLLCDGAMGTQLMAAGLRGGECGELWNTERASAVQAVHRAYLRSGCELITTNTFGATTIALAKHGLGKRARGINVAGAHLARDAGDGSAWVLGNIGPTGGFLQPVGEFTLREMLEAFVHQAEALAAAGIDAFLIETMSDTAEMTLAIRAAKCVATIPVIATFAFSGSNGSFRTMHGAKVQDAMCAARDAGADVVGANCGTVLDLDEYRRLADHLVSSAGSLRAIVQPNAGSPQLISGQVRYSATPAETGALAAVLVDCGVRIVGGCCGTTPAHLSAMSQALRECRRHRKTP